MPVEILSKSNLPNFLKGKNFVLAFMLQGCCNCDAYVSVLDTISEQLEGIRVGRITVGYDPLMYHWRQAKRINIERFPTTVVLGKKNAYFFTGNYGPDDTADMITTILNSAKVLPNDLVARISKFDPKGSRPDRRLMRFLRIPH
ncbi:hypothetical protein HYU45_03290 [Candidatus Daviesbacteria bacterium]|nr:hypothetical protein [Candidatus Daviesbacteria bacterium]